MHQLPINSAKIGVIKKVLKSNLDSVKFDLLNQNQYLAKNFRTYIILVSLFKIVTFFKINLVIIKEKIRPN